MDDKNIKEQALDMFREHTKVIHEAREELAKRMLDSNMSPEHWGIADNMDSILDGTMLTYKCWPVLNLKPRMNRANNDQL